MIKEVKEFMDTFLQAELKAKTLDVKKDTNKAEQAIKELYDYCIKECDNRLGVVTPIRVMDDSYYEKRQNVQYIIPRHLYKISKYKNPKYEEVYLVYVSIFINSERVKNYFEMTYCFMVVKLEGKYKIISQWMIDLDNKKNWIFSFGDPDIDINSPGEFQETERYLDPINDEDGMEKFKKDE